MKSYTCITLLILFFTACDKKGDLINTIPQPPLQALFTDENSAVLFISRRDLNSADWTMVRMTPGGEEQVIVTDQLVRCAPPVPSHDGKSILYTVYEGTKYSLYKVNATGDNKQLLISGEDACGGAQWSPDDTQIAFVTTVSDDFTPVINIMNSDGSDRKVITGTNVSSYQPQWFHDGKRIYFTEVTNYQPGVYSIHADGTNKKRISPANKSFGGAALSPDGSLMALVSGGNEPAQLHMLNLSTGAIKQLTFSSSPIAFPGYPRDGNSNPVWSPGGDKIAYVSFANGSPDIFVMNADGSGNKRLTDSPIRDEDPYWSKDGNFIFFSSNRDLNMGAEIYSMRADGSNQTPLTHWTGDDIYPALIHK
ncbi:MAG: PD40 domain-containing protein [Chitinophagaceae bacterium]|nr:PD40 domain-containing protein [Chitinophagaceae bacterium]